MLMRGRSDLAAMEMMLRLVKLVKLEMMLRLVRLVMEEKGG